MSSLPLAIESSPLDLMVQQIDEISTLPDVALRVIEVTNDPDAGAHELKVAIEADVSLSARVLRMVNSSAYGLRTPVTNLQMAVAYLGFRQIRNLALTACISDVFKDDCLIGSYRRKTLWRHMVSVGICARMVAVRREITQFEDVFLAGLMHDIGILIEDQYCHNRFCQMMESLDRTQSLEANERQRLGFAHTDLGAAVAQAWRFPELVVETVRHHHSSINYAGEYIDTIRCVEVANMLCTFKGIPSVGVNLLRPAVTAVNALRLSKPDLEALLTDLDEELRRCHELFNM